MPYVLVNYTYLFPNMLKNNPFFLVGVNFQKNVQNSRFFIFEFSMYFWNIS